MSKATIEQFCQYLVEKYLKGKLYAQVNWSDIYHRIERQNLTEREEREVRAFITEQHAIMVARESDAKRKANQSKKASEQSMFRFVLGLVSI